MMLVVPMVAQRPACSGSVSKMKPSRLQNRAPHARLDAIKKGGDLKLRKGCHSKPELGHFATLIPAKAHELNAEGSWRLDQCGTVACVWLVCPLFYEALQGFVRPAWQHDQWNELFGNKQSVRLLGILSGSVLMGKRDKVNGLCPIAFGWHPLPEQRSQQRKQAKIVSMP